MLFVIAASCGAAAEQRQLRGRNAACDDNSKMQLWDISSNSPLIRDDMLRKDYCWRTVEGVRVDVLQNIGRFSRVRNAGGGTEYLVYGTDLEKVPERRERPEPKNVSVNSLTLVSIKNSFESPSEGVNPTERVPLVTLTFRAKPSLTIFYQVVKSGIKAGLNESLLDEKFDRNKNPVISAAAKCEPKGYTTFPQAHGLKILELNEIEKRTVLLISFQYRCLADVTTNYSINDARVELKGENYTNFVRRLTDRELSAK